VILARSDFTKEVTMKIELAPIGVVCSTRAKVEDDNWDSERAFIKLDESQLSAQALAGLEDFSHVEVIFYMNQVDPAKIETAARHPRNNTAWPKVGILAQRGKNRPNQIGTTICRVLEVKGSELHVSGLDAVDGSPVLDIKPWVAEFGPRGEVKEPTWISELMLGYWNDGSAK
jgi:tRNA-Thr(GGU) m(6)t(6)A37 methyltransferase TsaA